MKRILASFLTLTFLSISARAELTAAEETYFTIKNIKVQKLREETQEQSIQSLMDAGDCESDFGLMEENPAQPPVTSPVTSPGVTPGNPIDEITIIVDKIINLGKKIWAVVESGKPVVNFKADTASALPKGAKCWQDLGGWQNPKSYVYGVTFENGFGAEVVNFQYRILYVAGGSVDGVGQYIAYATMQPVQLDVAWGYTFNATAKVPTVFNQGTKKQPLAGMQLSMNWSVETVLKRTEETQAYFINGAGAFQQMK